MRDLVGLGGAGRLSLHLALTLLWARPYWVVMAEGSEWAGGCQQAGGGEG